MTKVKGFFLKSDAETFVEYSYLRFGLIKCYHTAVLPGKIAGENRYTEAEIKELIFQRYGHKVKSIINTTI